MNGNVNEIDHRRAAVADAEGLRSTASCSEGYGLGRRRAIEQYRRSTQRLW